MDDVGRSILFIVILVSLSAFFSASEMAFSSLNRLRVKNAAENGNKRAKLVLAMQEKFDALLSTILVGNNIVNILSSVLATILFVEQFELGSALGTTMATVVMTAVVLVFGEVLPKSIAKSSPEKFAYVFAPFLKGFSYLCFPITIFLVGIKKGFSFIFRRKAVESTAITEDEMITFVEEAEQEGSINEMESELIRSAIEFNDREAQDILTHRVDLVAVEDDVTKEELMTIFAESGFSRLPVYHDTIDNIIGVIHQKDFFNMVIAGTASVLDIIKQVVPIHKTMKISDTLRLLQKSKVHMAVVADNYGGTLGILTLEDIIEELVGEIWDEHDEVIEEIMKVSEETYRILCSASLDSLFEEFDLKSDAEDSTVGGWVMSELDKIPAEGDSFTFEHLQVVVTKIDARRVLEIEVTPQPLEEELTKAEKENAKKKEKEHDTKEED